MTDLWAGQRKERLARVAPLATRMRPRNLDEFVGQEHFLGPGKLLRRMLDADRLSSLLLHGPPGTGKTTLAEILALTTHSRYEQANAAMIGVRDVRRVIDEATRAVELNAQRTVYFLDEIHRFNRAQQDVLLRDVERGIIILIGATTENPYYAVNSALVSRSIVFRFEPLSEADIITLCRRAITDSERGLGMLKLTVDEAALAHWARTSDGDARRALTALEIAALSAPISQTDEPIHIDLAAAQDSIQHKALVHDATGDEHYDVVSAFIKSMRGSDPDATTYWLARLIEAGEDPRFIARRIAILASEDIGNADPGAISVASSAFEIVERVGYPEAELTLAQAAIYMAVAPKSNASAQAIWEARKDVREGRTIAVPPALRDTSSPAGKKQGHGIGYQYAHNHADGVVHGQHLGIDRVYYEPTTHGLEEAIGKRLAQLRAVHRDKSG